MAADIWKEIGKYLEARRELEGGLYLEDDIVKEFHRAASKSGVQFESLEEFGKRISSCQKCSLGKSRIHFVFGKGNPHARVVFIGEAPGRDEDMQGFPFVGRAGKLLDEVLESSGFTQNEIYICNILKCRPPENRDPKPEEIQQCEPYLWKQLEIINPAMMVALGRVAAQTLLKIDTPIGKMKKTVYQYRGKPLFVTYHPAYILRNMNNRGELEEDMLKIRRYFETGKF